MPVLTNMQQIPERVWVDFLRANLIPAEEIPLIVPLERSFFMLSIPDVGFLVTATRLVIFRKKFMHGLIKHDEGLLLHLKHFSYSSYEKGHEFFFGFVDGKEYWVKIAVNAKEAQLIAMKLFQLVPTLACENSLF
jgi:hypothetical protein